MGLFNIDLKELLSIKGIVICVHNGIVFFITILFTIINLFLFILTLLCTYFFIFDCYESFRSLMDKDTYIFITKMFSSIEMMLTIILIYILIIAIFNLFIANYILDRKTYMKKLSEAIKETKHQLSTPFILSIGSICIVLIFSLITEIYKLISLLKDNTLFQIDILSYKINYVYIQIGLYFLLILIIIIALNVICKFTRLESEI